MLAKTRMELHTAFLENTKTRKKGFQSNTTYTLFQLYIKWIKNKKNQKLQIKRNAMKGIPGI